MRVILLLEFRLVVYVIRVSIEKLKSDDNQPWIKDETGVPSYVNEVKCHVELFLCELL